MKNSPLNLKVNTDRFIFPKENKQSNKNKYYMYNNGNFPKTYAKIENDELINCEKNESTLIIKDTGNETNEIESYFSNLSSICGINTCRTNIIEISESKNIFATQRFDIDKEGNQIKLQSLHSFLKFNKQNQFSFSFDEIAFDITKANLNIEEFAKRTIFAYMTHNYDLHTRNFSVVKNSSGKYEFSKSYDNLCLCHEYKKSNIFAYSINGKKENISASDLIENISFYLGKDKSISIANDIKNNIINNINNISETKISKDTVSLILNGIYKRAADFDLQYNTKFNFILKDSQANNYMKKYSNLKTPNLINTNKIEERIFEYADTLSDFLKEKQQNADFIFKEDENGKLTIQDKPINPDQSLK